jgi:hypothetical protein
MIAGPVVVRCLGLVGRALALHHGKTPAGEYLASFEPEAHDGRGLATFTPDRARAKVFPDFKAAYEFIGTRPKKRPTRPDGKPNRPLTAFTLDIEPLDAAEG